MKNTSSLTRKHGWILKIGLLFIVCAVSIFTISFYMASKYFIYVLLVNAIFSGASISIIGMISWDHWINSNKNS